MKNLRRKNKSDIALGDIVNISSFEQVYIGCTVVAFEHDIENDYTSEKVYAFCVYPETFIPKLGMQRNKFPLEPNGFVSAVSDTSLYVDKYCIWKSFDYIDEVFEAEVLPDSSMCTVCKVHFEWAQPNQSDNTFKCFSCRQNPTRAYY
jgi:hypothetical protein